MTISIIFCHTIFHSKTTDMFIIQLYFIFLCLAGKKHHYLFSRDCIPFSVFCFTNSLHSTQWLLTIQHFKISICIIFRKRPLINHSNYIYHYKSIQFFSTAQRNLNLNNLKTTISCESQITQSGHFSFSDNIY